VWADPPRTPADVRARTVSAGLRRVRPCLMTTATTTLAMLTEAEGCPPKSRHGGVRRVRRAPLHEVPLHEVPLHEVPFHEVPFHGAPFHGGPFHGGPFHAGPLLEDHPVEGRFPLVPGLEERGDRSSHWHCLCAPHLLHKEPPIRASPPRRHPRPMGFLPQRPPCWTPVAGSRPFRDPRCPVALSRRRPGGRARRRRCHRWRDRRGRRSSGPRCGERRL